MDSLLEKIEPEILNLLEGLRKAGGRPLLVGGWVRDSLLGFTSHDIDIEVFGLDPESLKRTLEKYGQVFAVGVSFGVLKVRLGPGETIDVALPRRESLQGPRGHLSQPDPTMTPQEAASRRDFTINAMAYDPASRELLDFFDGQGDLKQGILRRVGDAFTEDPLRVLRGMQFAARWNFRMAEETAEYCKTLRDRYAALAGQRVWGEWHKLFEKGKIPSVGLAVLEQTGWRSLYPELERLAQLPEGKQTAWQHTLEALDLAVDICERDGLEGSEREILMLAALCHEFGYVAPLVGRAYGEPNPAQVEAAIDRTEQFLRSIDCPHYLAVKVIPLVREHLAHRLEGNEKPDPAKVRHLAQRLAPAGIDQWERLVQVCANSGGEIKGERPAERPAQSWLELAEQLECARQPIPPLVLGRHIVEAGLKPGKQFREILDRAYTAQLDGKFDSEEGGKAWLVEQAEILVGKAAEKLKSSNQEPLEGERKTTPDLPAERPEDLL